jgi:hypothetical protein
MTIVTDDILRDDEGTIRLVILVTELSLYRRMREKGGWLEHQKQQTMH